MRVDAVSSAAVSITGSRRAVSDKADKTNHQAAPSPRGNAYGVVRKLGTGHYSATAEARLTSHFGHLVESTTPPPPPPPDVDVEVEGAAADGPADSPFSTPPAEPTEQISESGTSEYVQIFGRAIDLWA